MILWSVKENSKVERATGSIRIAGKLLIVYLTSIVVAKRSPFLLISRRIILFITLNLEEPSLNLHEFNDILFDFGIVDEDLLLIV